MPAYGRMPSHYYIRMLSLVAQKLCSCTLIILGKLAPISTGCFHKQYLQLSVFIGVWHSICQYTSLLSYTSCTASVLYTTCLGLLLVT